MEQENEYGNYIPTSKAELNSYISDVQIYLYFFGPFNEDQFYHSPFRKEKFGSFKFKYDNGKLCWVDYGDDFRLKDSIDFVQKKFSLSFYQALEYIYLTVVLGKDIPLEQNIKKRIVENIIYSCRITKKFTQDQLLYWEKGEFIKTDLSFYNIYTGEIWGNNTRMYKSIDSNPLFIYVFDKQKKIWKGYFPYAVEPNPKFFSNNIIEHIQNYDKIGLFGSDVLFITKSYKDCMVLNKLGYDAIAPHSEHLFLTPWDIDYLKSVYKYIYIFFDNDSTGIKRSIEFTELYHLNYINVPISLSNNNLKIKDPWDVVDHFDYKLLNNLIIDKFIKDGI